MLRSGMVFPRLPGMFALWWRLLLAFSCGMPLGLQGGTIAPQPAPQGERSLEFLQARSREIRQELGSLAFENIEEGQGSVGFESANYNDPEHREWVQVNWGAPARIDEVVLVPLLWQLESAAYGAGGFPLEFRVVAGGGDSGEETELASFREGDGHLPRSAPLAIPCDTTACWVRIEVSRLSKRIQDDIYNLQLAEVLVFSGGKNVALNAEVTTSSHCREPGRRSRMALTDGYMPYGMHTAGGESSAPFIAWRESEEPLSLDIDLGESLPIHQINLLAIDSRRTAPRDIAADYGIPEHLVIEGANREDFSDAVVLVDRLKKGSIDSGAMLMLPFPETRCRYLRLVSLRNHESTAIFGFAEIEVLSDGRNVALGKPIRVAGAELSRRSESATDGLNLLGRVLPLQPWVGELARRHDLERELPRVTREIQSHYARQKTQLVILGWLVGLALGGGLFAALLLQIGKMRQIAALRERFAADLHDELGTNLHSINMLAGIASEDRHSPEELDKLLKEIKDLVESTAVAARYCIEKQTTHLGQKLPEDMKNISSRTLADIEWSLEVVGEKHLQGLRGTFLHDLFLFYKECLVNISRHSMASRVRATLRTDAKSIELLVEDNGRGLDGSSPKSLKRRARLLGGKITFPKGDTGGAAIRLQLRRPRPSLFALLRRLTPKTHD